MTRDHYPSVTIVAGQIRHVPGITSPLLRMFDGQIYIQISPEIAKQWIPVLTKIASKGINE